MIAGKESILSRKEPDTYSKNNSGSRRQVVAAAANK